MFFSEILDNHDERLTKLEEKTKSVDDLLEGKIGDVKIIGFRQTNSSKEFTQIDIDNAVNVAIMAERERPVGVDLSATDAEVEQMVEDAVQAERERACRIVRNKAKAYISPTPSWVHVLRNEICHSIRTSTS